MDAIQSFINQNPFSASTKKHYRYILNRLAADVIDVMAISADDLYNWLEAQGWGDQMRWQAYACIRSFLRWTTGDDHPALRLKISRSQPGPQRCLDMNQAARLIASFDDSIYGLRDKALATVLLDTGLRCAEVCRLELKHIDLKKRLLSVLCKGSQWGFGAFSIETAEYIRAWSNVRQDIAASGVRTLFVSIKGLTPGYPLTPDGLNVIVRRWGVRIGIKLSPHDFRRSFAVISTQSGAPSRLVQIAGRWSSIKMVEHYTRNLTLADFEKYYPVNSIRRKNE